MTADRHVGIEARIRDRAYHFWLEEGRPHGRQDEHWRRAERELIEPEKRLREGPPQTVPLRAENREHAVAAEPDGASRSRAKSRGRDHSSTKTRASRSRSADSAAGLGSRASRRPAMTKPAE